MLNLIDVINSMRLDYVKMKYQTYDRKSLYVTCTIKEVNWKAIPVEASGKTEHEALNAAIDLLYKVKALNVKIEPYPVESVYDGGNKQVAIKKEEDFSYYVNYRREGSVLKIDMLYKQDDAGFRIHDNPKVANMKDYKLVDEHYPYDEGVVLKDGERLFSWDNTYGLAGTFGIAVLDSENRIVKSKMIGMS
jgi:hypothetical protein